jgi:hypothetical protein
VAPQAGFEPATCGIKPLLERKRRLRAIMPRIDPRLLYVHIPERGSALFRAACEHGLKGIIAKWLQGQQAVARANVEAVPGDNPGNDRTASEPRTAAWRIAAAAAHVELNPRRSRMAGEFGGRADAQRASRASSE